MKRKQHHVFVGTLCLVTLLVTTTVAFRIFYSTIFSQTL